MAGPTDKNSKTDARGGKVDTGSSGRGNSDADHTSVAQLSDKVRKSALTEEQEQQLKKELEEKTLKELMEMQKEAQRKKDEASKALEAAKGGDMSSLAPYLSNSNQGETRQIRNEDIDKAKEIIKKENLRDAKLITPLREGEDMAAGMERIKKTVRELLPNVKTELLVMRGDDGTSYIGVVGISSAEVDAAYALNAQQQQQQARADIITAKIQDTVKKGPEKQATADEHSIGAPPARAVTRDPAARHV